ncbi:cytochrome P450 [Saccharopolyspora dendranthemae]|uniref:Cytochrome P450 monooxygenase n=1 Tax=Saccharopolyspora dendranthemae TaxID=1181886 RepID=A0A561U3E4_9PSEU|nr:cytochrome P450 [Saccharopolyspora dendranthemae]TWF93884.1 cytochrome P450 monooxygenase [Saccharopolyspora dendranthemae]
MTASSEELPLVGVDRPSILSFSEVRLDLQAKAPVCRIRTPAGDEAWLVTQHAEVKALLQDNRLARYHPDPANAPRFLRNPMLDMLVTDTDVEVERKVHEEKRVLYTKSFAARRVLDRKSRVEAIAHAKIDDIIAAGQPADLHETFSTVFSQNALCDMIGIPEDAREELLTQMDRVGSVDREHAEGGMDSVFGFAAQVAERRRDDPGDDVITRFVESGLTDDEIGMHVVVLLFTGLAGLVSHIDFGVLLFLLNPDQRELAMNDPEIMARAVDEVMRATIGSPVLPRYASVDLEVGGVTIPSGDLVMLDFSLANFDWRVFAEPEKFDVTRTPNPHFTFGHGMRHCTGAPLVRVIMSVGFTALFSRLPELGLAVPQSELETRAGGKLAGGLERFPIRW